LPAATKPLSEKAPQATFSNELDTPIAGFNGGIFVHTDLAVIETHTLAPKIARQAVDLLMNHGLDVWVYRGNEWLVRDPRASHVDREQRTVQFPPTSVENFDAALDEAVKIVGVSDDYERVERCEAAARHSLATLASAARSQPYYLDVTHPMANKGEVVRFLSRHLDIPPHEIATIGDMPNDILMFREAALAIAMGNGGPEVQGAADVVTDTCEDEGFAKAVERFILESPGAAHP
jgi:Cof subfamily protein (haloacid dehalogenase superfamily)